MKLDDMQRVSQMTGWDVSILSKLSEEYHVELVLALEFKEYHRLHKIIENGYNAYLLGCVSNPKGELKRRGEACVEQLIGAYEFASDLPETTEEMLRQELMRIIAEKQEG
mgnify:CR=1 FL=1